jgi:hypothetical protein
MARPKRSFLQRILVQTDCGFWCIHDHVVVVAYLALPTLVALVASALGFVWVWRTWDLPTLVDVVVAAVVMPFLLLFIFSALPLPCAVFAWKTAQGEPTTVGECYAWCWRRMGRLLSVFFRLGLVWLVSLIFAGIPLLVVWPRTCLTPIVALFENDRKIFRRARRMFRDDSVVTLMGAIYLGMGLVLGGLLVLPRLLISTPMLGANLLDARWRPAITEQLWIFETTSVAILLTAIAVNWWITLTLVYHDIRWIREGEGLKHQVALLRAKLDV